MSLNLAFYYCLHEVKLSGTVKSHTFELIFLSWESMGIFLYIILQVSWLSRGIQWNWKSDKKEYCGFNKK